MDSPKLIKKIELAKKEEEALNQLLSDFLPLNQKYACLLGYQDALSDLQFDFIMLIINFKVETFYPKKDAYVLAYIAKSVRNAYIKRAKAICAYRKHYIVISSLSDEDDNLLDRIAFTHDNYSEIDLQELKNILSKQQFKIIYHLYFLNETSKEVGQALGISRQAVYKTKTKALEKLRQAWC